MKRGKYEKIFIVVSFIVISVSVFRQSGLCRLHGGNRRFFERSSPARG